MKPGFREKLFTTGNEYLIIKKKKNKSHYKLLATGNEHLIIYIMFIRFVLLKKYVLDLNSIILTL